LMHFAKLLRGNVAQLAASAVLHAADMEIKAKPYSEKGTASKRQKMAASSKKRIATGALCNEGHRKRI